MLNNSTLSINTDFYTFLTENSFAKVLFLTFSFSATAILPILLLSIIWYEKYGTDTRRTLINKFASSCCWCAIEYLIFVQTSDNIRYVFGPWPKWFCFMIRIVKSAIFFQLFLFIDLIVLSRYVYIFHLKNPAAFDDNFWAFFLNLWVTLAGLLFKGSVHFTADQVSISPITIY